MSSAVVDSRTTLVALDGLKSANFDAAKASERLATGLRINRSSDDPAGAGKAAVLKSEINSFMQVKRNVNSGLADISKVNDGLNSISDYLVEMRTLAVAANGESDSTIRTAYDTQFQALVTGINEIAASIKFGDSAVLSKAGTSDVQVGIGATDKKTLTFTAVTATALGLNALSLTTSANAIAALPAVVTAISTVANRMATIGGYESSLQNYSDLADSNILSKTSQYGDIMNADLALEASNLAAAKIRQDASTAMLAQANSMNKSIADYLLNGSLG